MMISQQSCSKTQLSVSLRQLLSCLTYLFCLGNILMNGKYCVSLPFQNAETTVHTNPSNFCPISLLSILSKLLEKHMAQLLTEYMAANSPISPHQWGFCCGKSTASALALAVVNGRHLEESNDKCTAFFDYKKSFDTFPHRNLLSELETLWY